jgi:hypothetical protein
MSSFPKGTALVASASSAAQPSPFVHSGFDPRHSQPGRSSEVTPLIRAEQSLVVRAKRLPRILLVEEAHALRELHRWLLQSIPAVVETLACCADLYAHQEPAYALVVLVLHSESREMARAAHFVRRRWSAARILLLESESATIDDWLYDERIDPRLQPTTLLEAAIRLMAEGKYLTPA